MNNVKFLKNKNIDNMGNRPTKHIDHCVKDLSRHKLWLWVCL